MKRIFGIFCLITLVCSCKLTPPLKYPYPTTVKMSHEDVMTLNYPAKQQVFAEFGTPDKKETFEKSENWFYKLGSTTQTTTLGLVTGRGLVYQNPLNPVLSPINRSIVIEQNQMINSTSNAVMRESYLKFWFTNDSVTKWETYGVDYSTDVANPNFNLEDFKRIETERGKIISRNKKVVASIYISVIVGFVALLVFKN